jgi:hypothetical protein
MSGEAHDDVSVAEMMNRLLVCEGLVLNDTLLKIIVQGVVVTF